MKSVDIAKDQNIIKSSVTSEVTSLSITEIIQELDNQLEELSCLQKEIRYFVKEIQIWTSSSRRLK